MQQKWYDEGMHHPDVVTFSDDKVEFILYKGVKLERTNDGHRLLDVRFNDFYSKLPRRDKKLLKIHGFVKGCDLMMYRRDLIRAQKYKMKIEHLYTKLDVYRKTLSKKRLRSDVRKRSLKMKSIYEHRIRNTIDLYLLYNSRIKQIEIKYNVKNEDKGGTSFLFQKGQQTA